MNLIGETAIVKWQKWDITVKKLVPKTIMSSGRPMMKTHPHLKLNLLMATLHSSNTVIVMTILNSLMGISMMLNRVSEIAQRKDLI